MGKLIKNHWARLLILTAAAYQILASCYAFFWPKLFFDFLTTTLDPCVRPFPILQILNLLLGILGVAWEWPLPVFVAASTRRQQQQRSRRRRRRGAAGANAGVYDDDVDAAAVGQRAWRPSERANTTKDTTKQGLQAAVTAAAVEMDANADGAATAGGGGERHESGGRGSWGATVDAVLSGMHRSIEARLMVYPLSSLASLLMYQGTNAGLYYIIGMGVYFWAFSEGEVVMAVPWTLPKRRKVVGMV